MPVRLTLGFDYATSWRHVDTASNGRGEPSCRGKRNRETRVSMRFPCFWFAIVTMACGHSIEPNAKPRTTFVQHLDSLATQECAATAKYAALRCRILRLAEAAPAAGVAPAPTTVRYKGTGQTWLAPVLDSNEIANGDSLILNVYNVIAYSDSNLSVAYYGRFQLLADDSTYTLRAVIAYGDTNVSAGLAGWPRLC